jgi:peroxiredoxin Q/BCP
MALAAGVRAPDFTAPVTGGEPLHFKSLRGSWVVLYFYPKDDTSGCTAEACDFRDNMARLKRAGITVIGVSPDPVKAHDKFTAKYDLTFPLVSDAEHTICEAYDVRKEKSMYGRKYMGVVRTTYAIDPKGVIRHVWEKVSVPGHVDDVLTTVKGLQKA